MAKKATNKKENLPMEEVLWKACDALRGSIEPSEYKHVVLSLIFLKYAGFHFDKRRREIINDGLEDFVDSVEFYAAKNVFYLPETARWTYIKENAKQPNVASIVDKALSDIEKENKPLRGALPNNYYSSLGIEAEKLGSLLDKVDGFDTILESADGNDIIGRVYEYSNYKRLGNYIRQVDVRNRDLVVNKLLGLSIAKQFITSIANTTGTDMSTYKIVQPRQFGYVPVTSRNGDKITIALYEGESPCIISQIYIMWMRNEKKSQRSANKHAL